MGSIYEFAKQQRDDYRSRTIQIADGYEFSQYKTLRAIGLYHNSRFLSGNKDSLGREKPSYNITKFRVNFATCATDIDTKNVRVVSDAADGKTPHFILNEAMDTTTPGGRLLFHICSALAEFERGIIRERTAAGLAAARAQGRMGGAKRKLDEAAKREARALLAIPESTAKSVAERFGVSVATLYREIPKARNSVA